MLVEIVRFVPTKVGMSEYISANQPILNNNPNSNNNIPNLNNAASFGSRSFQDEGNVNQTLKKHLGPEFLSERAGPGGKKVPYLEGIRYRFFVLSRCSSLPKCQGTNGCPFIISPASFTGWKVMENANHVFQFNGKIYLQFSSYLSSFL